MSNEPTTEAGRRLRKYIEPVEDPEYTSWESLIAAVEWEASGRVAAGDAADVRQEVIRLRAALANAFVVLDAACVWAAGETAGVKTAADAQRHTAGYDALLDGTVRAGIAAGVLRERVA